MLIFSNLWIGSLDACDIKIILDNQKRLQLKVKLYYSSSKGNYEYYIDSDRIQENENAKFMTTTKQDTIISDIDQWMDTYKVTTIIEEESGDKNTKQF
jgi:hypothetical protein